MSDTSCINYTDCTVTGIPVGYPTNPYAGYGGNLGVSLEQTVSGLTIGNIYILEFWAGGEAGTPFLNNGLFGVDVGFGYTILKNKPTLPFSGIGTRYIIEFIATSTAHTIKFTNWGHICNSCTELVIDDARLYTLPELSATVPQCATGINENAGLQSMKYIFPNPIKNELHVEIQSYELSEIILSDIYSRKLIQQQFINSVSINTERLAKGIYIYEVRSKKGIVLKGKVIKE